MNVVEAFLADQYRRLRIGTPQQQFSTLMLTPRFRASSHVIFLVFTGHARQPYLVAKVARLPEANESLAREASNLAEIQRLRPGGFESVPQLIAFELFHGTPLLIETALGGRLMSPAFVRKHPEHCCRLMSDWLIDLQRASVSMRTDDWYETIVEAPLERFRARFPVTADENAMIDRTLAAGNGVASVGLPFIFEHGDLSHPNIMLTGRSSVGIVDWELAQRYGLIGADLFVFLAYVAFSRAAAPDADAQVQSVLDAFGPDGWGTQVAVNFARRAGIDESWLPPLFALCWARYTASLLDRLIDGDDATRGVASAEAAAWLRANRYYRLWGRAVQSLEGSWAGADAGSKDPAPRTMI